jgi:uncharacterized membrane protein YfcA
MGTSTSTSTVSWWDRIKPVTHWLAAAALAVYGFLLSPAGVALRQQYPKLAPILGALTTIGGLYFVSTKAKSSS